MFFCLFVYDVTNKCEKKKFHEIIHQQKHFNLRDPTGTKVLVLQKICIDFRLSTRLLPLALEDLCAAGSLGIAQRVC